MVSDKEIEPPHTLATLPRPIDPVHGSICASCVYGLRSLRKRKRAEVVVGIDGEGMNIYNVKSPSLVTSYALPPHTSFAAPPVSIYRKRGKSQPAERSTYAPILSGTTSKSVEIVRFVEEVQQTPGPGPVTSKRRLSSKSPIFSLDVVPHRTTSDATLDTASDSIDIVIVHKDGKIACVSGDLQTMRWESNMLVGGPDKAQSIRYAAILDGTSAAKGLLKNRGDVIASINPAGQADEAGLRSCQILCVVSCSNEASGVGPPQLHLFLLHGFGGMTGQSRSKIQHLMALSIGQSDDEDALETPPKYSLHAPSGTLYQLHQGRIITYDLTGTVPTTVSELKTSAPIQTFVRLSSSFLVAASTQLCGLYDVRYTSQQAAVLLGTSQQATSPSKKRKIDETAADSSRLTILDYVSEVNSVIALSDNELVGFQVNLGQSGRGLLIDSIGKGVFTDPSAASQPLDSKYDTFIRRVSTGFDAEWPPVQERLAQLVSEEDVPTFENMFADALGIPRTASSPDHEGLNQKSSSELTNGHSHDSAMANGFDPHDESPEDDPPEQDEDQPSSLDWDFRAVHKMQPDRKKAIFALQSIFSALPSSIGPASPRGQRVESPLSIRFFPPNVFHWLLMTGQLTCELLNAALQSSSSLAASEALTDADLISALVAYDPDMHILHSVLRERIHIPIKSVAQSIKHLVRSLDNTPPPPPSKPASPQRQLTLGMEPTTDELLAAAEEAAADADLHHALTTLEFGLTTRSRSLRYALTRLNSFPSPLIAPALREALTRHELVFLIQILRVELADGGWTSRYVDAGPQSLALTSNDDEGDEGGPSNRGIGIIAGLLGNVLDALGMAGWLGGQGTAMSEDELLFALRAEVSAALEGIHESIFLEGLLGEFLLYHSSVNNTGKDAVPYSTSGKKSEDAKAKAKPALEGSDEAEARILPMGMKPPKPIGPVKSQSNGTRKEKSRRERGMERSMRVPKYSVERIRF